MKTSKFTEHQIFEILKQAEKGRSAADLCREYGIANATFYKWRTKYAGADLSMIKRIKELEVENAKLRHMYADSQLDLMFAKAVIAKK